jgi:hypothetical protein
MQAGGVVAGERGHRNGEDGEADRPPQQAGDRELPASKVGGAGDDADHRQGRHADRSGDEHGL